ncbi:hypothetical protein QTP88_016581 [Uroleucon formosanum]
MSQLIKLIEEASNKNSKLRLLKALTFSVMLYGSATWALEVEDVKRINAFEMWTYRQILRISWIERRTNFSILVMLNVETRLAVMCKQTTLRFFGHIIRRDRSSLEKLMIKGKIEGKISRGRTPMRWIDQIKTITGYPLREAIRLAENRELRKEIVANVN